MSATCLNCDRYDVGGKNFLPPFTIKGSSILIIGDEPSEYELKAGAIFTDKPGLTLKMILNDIINSLGTQGGTQLHFSYANTVQCYSTNKLSANTIRMCVPKLEAIINEVNPRLIIALGMNVVNALQLEASKLKDIRGVTVKKVIGGVERDIFVTFNIEDIFKSNGKINVFKLNLTNAIRQIVQQEEDVGETFNVATYKSTEEILQVLQEGIDFIDRKYAATNKKVLVSLDTETRWDSPSIPDAKIIAVSLCWSEERGGIAFCTNHKDYPRSAEDIELIYKKLSEITSSNKVALSLANGKYDYGFLCKAGLPPIKAVWDIILAEHLLDEDKKGEYSLKVVSTDYFPSLHKYATALNEEMARVKCAIEEKRKEQLLIQQEERYKSIFNEFIQLPQEKLNVLNDYIEGISTDELSLTNKTLLSTWIQYRGGFKQEEGLWECILPNKKKKQITLTKLLVVLQKILIIPYVGVNILPKSYKEFVDVETSTLKPLKLHDFEEFNYEMLDLDVLLVYAAMDAVTTYKLTLAQVKKFREDDKKVALITSKEVMEGEIPSLFYTMNRLSMPLSNELADIEYQGVTIDKNKLHGIIEELNKKYDELLIKLTNSISSGVNIFSSKQLSDYLFNTLNVAPIKYTKTGAPSVDESTLESIAKANDLDVLNDILTVKKIHKALNTYLINWDSMSNWDNKLHASFNIIGTATGRLSSSNPNLQNVPAYLAGVNMKSMFIPDSDEYVIVDCDISNAEMRVLCAYSKEPNLINAFNEDKDQHSITAEILSDGEMTYERLNMFKDDKTSEEYIWRQIGKRTNFGVIFGITEIGLVGQAPIDKLVEKELAKRFSTQEERDAYLSTLVYAPNPQRPPIAYGFDAATYLKARQIINTFLDSNPGIKSYVKRTQYHVEAYKVVLTLTGRRRRFELGKYDKNAIYDAKRQAINARIQGTSSDIVTSNLVSINKVLKHLNLGRVLLTVHDSICFQVKKEYLDLVKPMLDLLVVDWVKEMFPWLPVDWAYGAEYGPSYGEAHENLPNSGKNFFTLCEEYGINFTKEDLVNLLK